MDNEFRLEEELKTLHEWLVQRTGLTITAQIKRNLMLFLNPPHFFRLYPPGSIITKTNLTHYANLMPFCARAFANSYFLMGLRFTTGVSAIFHAHSVYR